MNIEELFLEAEADIKKNAHVDALRKYETILYDEPNHAPTHNSLGWIYKTQFDDNGTLTESECSLAAYEFFKYAEPEIVQALEEIAQALEEAAEEDTIADEAVLKQLNQTVGGIEADFAKGYYVLARTSGIYGDKTVTATIDPTTGNFL